MRRLNRAGMAHYMALAAVVVGAAAFGTFALVKSHAQVPSDGPKMSGSCTVRLASNTVESGKTYKLFVKNTGKTSISPTIYTSAYQLAPKHFTYFKNVALMNKFSIAPGQTLRVPGGGVGFGTDGKTKNTAKHQVDVRGTNPSFFCSVTN